MSQLGDTGGLAPPAGPHAARKGPSLYQRFLMRLSQRRRKWTRGTWTIRQSNLYIVPNRYGFYVGFLVFASFAMGYKVQNNFILLGVIFLFLVFMLSLIASVRNLQSLRISVLPTPYYLADHPQFLKLAFAKDDPAFNIEVEGTGAPAPLDLSHGATQAQIPIGPLPRGAHKVPPVKLQTQFPFGIARCWSWLQPPGTLLVCPVPDEQPLNRYPRGDFSALEKDKSNQMAPDQADNLGDLRDYDDTDPPARIDWKRFAATRELMVRDRNTQEVGEILLEQPGGDYEAGLSYLCGGILVCERHNLPVIMRLNGQLYRMMTSAQRLEGLHALARA